MNERIRELMEQAGPLQEVLSEIYGGTPGRYVRNKALLDFQLEKFAELIVKETLQVARAGIEYGDGMEDAVYKYFGVEE